MILLKLILFFLATILRFGYPAPRPPPLYIYLYAAFDPASILNTVYTCRDWMQTQNFLESDKLFLSEVLVCIMLNMKYLALHQPQL